METLTVRSINAGNGHPALAPARRRAGFFRRLQRQLISRVPKSLILVSGRSIRREIALTFDDGPDDRTQEYLGLLSEHRAKATFFLIGKQAKANPDQVRRIVEAGHEVAGHGFTHRPFPSLKRHVLQAELRETAAVLPPPPLGAQRLVRPPRGAVTLRSLAVTISCGQTTVLWSIDSDDCRDSDAEGLVRRLHPDRLRPGDIVLLHENQQWDLDALPRIIKQLQASGFALVTVSELLR